MSTRASLAENGARLIGVLQHEIDDGDIQPWHRDVYQKIIGYVMDTTALSVEVAQALHVLIDALRPQLSPEQFAELERLL